MARGGSPGFQAGDKVEMTLGFSPGVWKLERFYGLTPVPETGNVSQSAALAQSNSGTALKKLSK